MKCLVTGGAVSKGSHSEEMLIIKVHKIVVMDNLSYGKKENFNTEAKFYIADICDTKISQLKNL
jgi:UDP-glucose 4-epimerase